jgi:hypothetical protein
MAKPRAFDGRIIFDHLPKTAGQAVNAWLVNALGGSCVTDNKSGVHQELIRLYGGEYSVISAHVAFEGHGLDPRYHYITCLREPVDRTASWLYFVLSNHAPSQLTDIWPAAERFIASEGEELDQCLLGHISNPYVNHFSNIFSTRERNDAEKLGDALHAIEEYDAWGLFEELSDFLSDMAALIGLPAPEQLKRVNVTRARQSVDELSPQLHQRLEELNALDIEFYRILRERWQEKHSNQLSANSTHSAVSPWEPYYREAVTTASGTLWTDAILSTMGTSTEITLPIQLQSSSPEAWVSHQKLPIELSYHWLDQAGTPVIFEGECTPLSISVIHHLHTFSLKMRIVAPDTPGQYQLVLLPVQGKRIWFDTLGFSPYVLSVKVTDLSATQCYAGADARFQTEVGRREDGEIFSTGHEGFLLFGPYTPLSAGHYEVQVNGFQESGAVGVWVDATWHAASQSVPFTDVTHTDADSESISATLIFELTEDVSDLEVRIWVNAEVDASIHSIQIRPCITTDAISQ